MDCCLTCSHVYIQDSKRVRAVYSSLLSHFNAVDDSLQARRMDVSKEKSTWKH